MIPFATMLDCEPMVKMSDWFPPVPLQPVVERPNTLYGFKIIEEPAMEIEKRVQFRFPKSKKRRIRKKWSRRSENWKDVPQSGILMVNGTLFIHPLRMTELRAQLERRVMDGILSTFNTPVDGLRSNTVEPFVVCPNGSEKP